MATRSGKKYTSDQKKPKGAFADTDEVPMDNPVKADKMIAAAYKVYSTRLDAPIFASRETCNSFAVLKTSEKHYIDRSTIWVERLASRGGRKVGCVGVAAPIAFKTYGELVFAIARLLGEDDKSLSQPASDAKAVHH